jgi:AcrR family transcriptional regulator
MTEPVGEVDVPLGVQAVRRRLARRQVDAEQDVQRLLDSGRELMQGGANPRVADIVRAAGLSNDAFYRYFKTKDDLVAAIVDDGARRLLEVLGRRIQQVQGPELQLRTAIQQIFKQAVDPEVALATRNVFGNSTIRDRVDRLGRFRLESGVAALLVAPLTQLGSTDPARDAEIIGVLAINMMDRFLWQDAEPSVRDIDHVVRFVLLGCGVAE